MFAATVFNPQFVATPALSSRARDATRARSSCVDGPALHSYAPAVARHIPTSRVGEARHPGPAIRTTFDDPEADDSQVDQFMDDVGMWQDVEADGVAVGNHGWAEFDVETEADNARIPAHLYYDMAGRCVQDGAAGFSWPVEDVADCTMDDLEAIALGDPGGGAREPPMDLAARQLKEFHEAHGSGAEPSVGEGVPLPADLEQRLNREDDYARGVRYEKWAAFFDRIAANRETLAGRRAESTQKRRAMVGADAQRGNRPYDLVAVPVVQEQVENDPGSVEHRDCADVGDQLPQAPQPQAPRRRARGRRQRGSREVEVVLLNSSGAPQLRQALTTARASGRKVVTILAQEHHQTDQRAADLQTYAQQCGWAAAIVPAVAGRGHGPSAGVAVLSASHVPSGLLATAHCDCSPPESKGRLGAVWTQDIVPCGVVNITIYLHTAEGPTPRNVNLVARALETAKASGCPWILGGDWQDTPAAVVSWAGEMISRAGGLVVAPDSPTIYPSTGEPRVIDFFVISNQLGPLVRTVEVDDSFPAAPHRAVKLTLVKDGPLPMQYVRRGPRKFPRDKPIGCARRPVAPSAHRMGIDEIGEDRDANALKAAEAWRCITRAMEVEMCGVTDKFVGNAVDPLWCGREDGHRYVQAPVMPARALGNLGRQNIATYWVRWAENRLRELGHLADVAARNGGRRRPVIGARNGGDAEGSGLSQGQWRQWERVTAKMTCAKSPLFNLASRSDQWANVLGMVSLYRHCPAGARHFAMTTADWANAILVETAKEAAAARRNGWTRWLREQIRAGGGGLHSYVKRKLQEPEKVLMWQGQLSAAPQDIVDRDTLEWEAIWTSRDNLASAPWRDGGRGAEPLPRPTVEEMRRAAYSFKVGTGTGVDGVPPRHYGWLSDELLGSIMDLLMFLEEVALWPCQVSEALMRLIPKPSGGRRPIGLLASLVRFWERIRRPILRTWRAEADRPYNWMGKGRGAQRAVWVQSVMDEACKQRGMSTGAVLVDLVKAFEQVVLAIVWREGVARGFPLQLLRLGLEACAFTRRLALGAAHARRTVDSLSAILAGSGFASDMMFLVLVKPMDTLVVEYPCLDIFVIADDVKLGVKGRDEDWVAKTTADISNRCIGLLEDELHMEVSRDKGTSSGKTVAVASSRTLEKKLGGRLTKTGIKMKKSVRNLGVDYQLGGRKRRDLQVGRYALWKSRAGRIARLGKAGGAFVMKTAAVKSITYGAAVCGMTDSMLACVRTMMAKTLGPLGGRSATARLLMEKCDPGLQVVVLPIMEWFNAVWGKVIPMDVMQDAWRWAIKTVGTSARPNSVVQGGAGAFVAALRRIGWSTPSAHAVVTCDGSLLYLGDGAPPPGAFVIDPRTLRKWATDDCEAAALANSQLTRDIMDIGGSRGYPRCVDQGTDPSPSRAYGSTEAEARLGRSWRLGRFATRNGDLMPWIWPMALVARAAKRKGRSMAAASLRACVEGGWWTQRRLYSAGVTADDRCRCGMAAGTLWHKLGKCSLADDVRARACSNATVRHGTAALWDPLYSRGVPCRPKIPPLPQPTTWWSVRREGVEKAASGDVYTDGSALGWFWRVVRAGWAAVALDEEGNELWTLSGVCAEPHASIFRAELRAVIETLRIAVPPLRIHVDNAQVVRGFQEGRLWGTAAGREAADMWREFWYLIEDIGEGVDIVKVTAHSTWWQVLTGSVTLRDHIGNSAADREAKLAMKAGMSQSPTTTFNAYLARAVAWGRYILDYSANWVDDTSVPQHAGEEAEDEMARRRVAVASSRDTLAHEVWETADRSVCRRCGRSALLGLAWKAYLSEPCRGSAAGRLLAETTGNRNHVWSQYFHSVDELRQKGGRLVSSPPVPDAMVDEARLHDGGTDPTTTEPRGDEVRRRPRPRDAAEPSTEDRRTRRRAPPLGEQSLWMSPPSWMYLPAQNIGTGELHEWEHGRGAVRARDEEEEGFTRQVRQRGGLSSADGHSPVDEAIASDQTGTAEHADDSSASGHVLRLTGGMIWCRRCARYAHRRVGVGLRGICQPSLGDATRRRLELLEQGCHPITGDRL